MQCSGRSAIRGMHIYMQQGFLAAMTILGVVYSGPWEWYPGSYVKKGTGRGTAVEPTAPVPAKVSCCRFARLSRSRIRTH